MKVNMHDSLRCSRAGRIDYVQPIRAKCSSNALCDLQARVQQSTPRPLLQRPDVYDVFLRDHQGMSEHGRSEWEERKNSARLVHHLRWLHTRHYPTETTVLVHEVYYVTQRGTTLPDWLGYAPASSGHLLPSHQTRPGVGAGRG